MRKDGVRRIPPMPRVKGRGLFSLSVHDSNWDEIVLRGKIGLTCEEMIDELCRVFEIEEDRAKKMDVPPGAVVPMYTFTVEAFCVA
jgi:hypothetical protein